MPIDTRDMESIEKLFGKTTNLAVAWFETGTRNAELDQFVASSPVATRAWSLPLFTDDEKICVRMAELLASRFTTLEDAFDWIVPITYGNGTMAAYVAQVLARRAQQDVSAVVRGQYMAAPAMIMLLKIIRAYNETLLGRYAKELRGPLSPTKSEKATILEYEPLAKQYAAELKVADKHAKAAADKAAKADRAAVVASKPGGQPIGVADPNVPMPAYNRGKPASAHIVVGHSIEGWVKTADYEAVVAHVEAARKELQIPLVCVPGGALTAKGGKDGWLLEDNARIAVGLEIATAWDNKPAGPIAPEAIDAAMRTLKRVPKDFWIRAHELVKERDPYMKVITMLLATGKNTVATVEKGTNAERTEVAALDNNNSWGMFPFKLDKLTDELFLRI